MVWLAMPRRVMCVRNGCGCMFVWSIRYAFAPFVIWYRYAVSSSVASCGHDVCVRNLVHNMFLTRRRFILGRAEWSHLCELRRCRFKYAGRNRGPGSGKPLVVAYVKSLTTICVFTSRRRQCYVSNNDVAKFYSSYSAFFIFRYLYWEGFSRPCAKRSLNLCM